MNWIYFKPFYSRGKKAVFFPTFFMASGVFAVSLPVRLKLSKTFLMTLKIKKNKYFGE